jgi:hypothetical protein
MVGPDVERAQRLVVNARQKIGVNGTAKVGRRPTASFLGCDLHRALQQNRRLLQALSAD